MNSGGAALTYYMMENKSPCFVMMGVCALCQHQFQRKNIKTTEHHASLVLKQKQLSILSCA